MSFTRKLKRDSAKFAFKEKIKKEKIPKKDRKPFKDFWEKMQEKYLGEDYKKRGIKV